MARRQQRPSSGLLCCGMESKSAYSDISKKNEQGDFMLDTYLFRKMPERHWHIFMSFLNAWHSVCGGYLQISPNKIEKIYAFQIAKLGKMYKILETSNKSK